MATPSMPKLKLYSVLRYVLVLGRKLYCSRGCFLQPSSSAFKHWARLRKAAIPTACDFRCCGCIGNGFKGLGQGVDQRNYCRGKGKGIGKLGSAMIFVGGGMFLNAPFLLAQFNYGIIRAFRTGSGGSWYRNPG